MVHFVSISSIMIVFDSLYVEWSGVRYVTCSIINNRAQKVEKEDPTMAVKSSQDFYESVLFLTKCGTPNAAPKSYI